MANYLYDHVHLFSNDPMKTAEFYESIFDAERVEVRQQPRLTVELRINGTRLLIGQTQQPLTSSENPALAHWGIKTDDLESLVAKLKGAGVRFRDEMREARPGIKMAFIWAPDNVLIELLEVKEP